MSLTIQSVFSPAFARYGQILEGYDLQSLLEALKATEKPMNAGFRVAIALPKGTNTQKRDFAAKTAEDRRLWAQNKWLLAHPDSPEAGQGAYVGLCGDNITVSGLRRNTIW